MINIEVFKNFLLNNFALSLLDINEFKEGLQFVEIDCMTDQDVKLAIEISKESIKVSTINKKPMLDFSLYDYSFNSNNEAEKLILEVKKSGKLPPRSKTL